MDKMIFDAGTHEVYKENWNNYDPGPVLLPCLARMYNMPDPLTHKLYKNGLTDANEDSLCDMNTDGGEKWEIVSLIASLIYTKTREKFTHFYSKSIKSA